MAQVPTSSITMAQIKAETGVATDATLDAARAASISYVRAANASPAGTGNNANVAPNNMRDWAGYLHAQSLGTINYGVRISTSVSSVLIEVCILTKSLI